MPRPKKRRMIRARPAATFFKPQGVPLAELKGKVLPLEGLEALRLTDVEGLGQSQAAEMMGISTATFCRVLAQAREAVALALVNGWAIRIEGGEYQFHEPRPGHPNDMGPGRGGRGRGRGRRRQY